MYRVPLWPHICVKGGQHLPRHMEQKCGDMENVLGNTLGTWGIHWVPDGNPFRTWKEHSGNRLRTRGKWKKHPPQNLEGKSARHLECMLGPSHWLHEIYLQKRVPHHFWPGLIPLAKNTLHIKGNISSAKGQAFWITRHQGGDSQSVFLGLMGLFDWPITKTCGQTSGTFKINMSYLVILFGLPTIGYNRPLGKGYDMTYTVVILRTHWERNK